MTAAPAGRIAPAPHPTRLRRATRLILMIPLVAGLLTSALRAEAASTITVTATDDIVADNGQCSLREAVANANNDNQSGSIDCPAGSGADTINLPNAAITLTSALTIQSAITISGAGTGSAIQAGTCNPITQPGGCIPAGFRALEVASGGLTLSGLTVRYGSCTSPCDGGGVLVDPGAALTLDAATVTANTASSGGGISNNGTLLVHSGTAIFFNMASAGGGGLANVGGTATLTDAAVTGNLADTGGGIISYSTLTIDSSHIDNNQSGTSGGALSLQHGTVTITNSSLSGNTGGQGSAAFIDNADEDAVSLTGSCITGNNGTAIQNAHVGAALSATSNWWGGPAGPTTPSVTTSYGDVVSDRVDVSNFKTMLPAGCDSASPYASLSPAPGFPEQLVNTTSAPKTITLANDGAHTLAISKVLVTGPYALTTNSCDGQNLASAATCAFALTFTPVGVGPQVGAVVIAGNADGGPQVYTITSTGLTPAAPPALSAPKNGAPVYKPPKLVWKPVRGAPAYHVEVDTASDFSSPKQSGDVTRPFFQTTALPFGLYYWHAAYKESVGHGAYSAALSFEVTLNKAPKKNAALKTGIAKFSWQSVKGKTYLLRVNDETAHTVYYQTPSPLSKPTFTVDKASPLPAGSYSWQVSIDGGASWTLAWAFTVN